MRTQTPHTRTTPAYYFQVVASFVVALGSTCVGVAYLPVSAWERAFLGMGLLYTVTSAITLAKVVRDKQEELSIVTRADQARLDKLITEHDPFRVDAP